MSDKFTVAEFKPQPNEALVSMLKNWLRDAESGELRGVFAVGSLANGNYRRGSVGAYKFSDMYYACGLAQAELLDEAREGNTSVDRDEDPDDG